MQYACEPAHAHVSFGHLFRVWLFPSLVEAGLSHVSVWEHEAGSSAHERQASVARVVEGQSRDNRLYIPGRVSLKPSPDDSS